MLDGHSVFGFITKISVTAKRHSSKENAQRVLRAVSAIGNPLKAYAVERLLAEHQGYVIDFGAGHSVFEDAGLREPAKAGFVVQNGVSTPCLRDL
jgi:hypothetical protein